MAVRGFAKLGLVTLLVAGALACASGRYETSSHFDTEYDFASVDSFALQAQRAKVTGSSGGQVLEDALRRNLVARGYVELPAEQADVLLEYDLGRYAPSKLSGSSSFAQTDGTLSVAVIDRATGRTVWYGWVETRLRPHDDLSLIGDAVDALFEDRVPRAAAPR
jgi:hypothetical protein